MGPAKLRFTGSVDYSSLNYRSPNHQPLVYYVTNANYLTTPTAMGPLKIGCTNQLGRRFYQYCRTRPEFKPRILAVEPDPTHGGRESERLWEFRDANISGDWFWQRDDLVTLINDLWEKGSQCSDLSFLSFTRRK